MNIQIDDREFHTVLAALRYWQRHGAWQDGAPNDLATNNGDIEALTPNEIDALCERINIGEPAPENAVKVLKRIAAFTKDGEILDGEEFDLSNDAAVDDLHCCIDMARAAVEATPKPPALVITLEDGTVQRVTLDGQDIAADIHDYDVSMREAHLETDDNGALYCLRHA